MTTPHKLAAVAAVAGSAAAVAGVLLPAAPAQAAAPTTGRPVPAALCVHAAPGVRHGVGECIQTTRHGHHELVWLGSYRTSAGQVFYCIDTDYSGRMTRYHLGTLADVRNQNGTPISSHTAQLLSFLVTSHGDTTNPRIAAGMQALIRAGMDDTGGRFGHLDGDR